MSPVMALAVFGFWVLIIVLFVHWWPTDEEVDEYTTFHPPDDVYDNRLTKVTEEEYEAYKAAADRYFARIEAKRNN